jgi:hypothetical protein
MGKTGYYGAGRGILMDIKTLFPRGSKTFYEINDYRESPNSIPEQAFRNEPVGQTEGKTGHTGRRSVRITSFRVRPVDPDNLCPKYFIDALRYAGAIPDDRQEDIELTTRQKKVKNYAEERTVIVIET